MADFADPERIPQTWIVGDADHVTEEVAAFIERYGITDLVSWVGSPGVPPYLVNDSVEQFATKVLPRLQARFGAEPDGGATK